MKNIIVVLLIMALLFGCLSACRGKSGKAPSESSAPAESGNNPSGEAGADESEYYGIGEVAEANGLSITIDRAETFDYTGMLSRPKDGFEYIRVWFTFTNISNKPIDSPDRKDIYIIYEEGPTGDDSDMTSEENSQVMSDVADRNERYMEDVELAPGESVGGWMVYQRQSDKNEVTMHYYSGFVNVAPDLKFRFTPDASAGEIPKAHTSTLEAASKPENGQTSDYSGFSLEEITGTYNLLAAGTEDYFQIELFTSGDMLVLRFADETETEYEYDLIFGVATRLAEFDDGHTVLTVLTFTREGDAIHLAVDESYTYADGSTKTGNYEGYKVV